MNDYLKAFLLAGVLFGTIMGLFVGFFSNFLMGFIAGIILGSLFGTIISGFIYIQSNKFKKNGPKDIDSNNLVLEGSANHLIGAESVGGWLYLTQKELIFMSHKYNIQNHKLIIPINQITSINYAYTLGFIPNGLLIITESYIEKFVLFNRKRWHEKINEIISSMS